MNKILINKEIAMTFCMALLVLTGCASHRRSTTPLVDEQATTHYTLSSVTGNRIEVSAAYDANPDAKAKALLEDYKKRVDNIMSPVIGESTHFMEGKAPESDLSNLVADALRYGAQKYGEKGADVALSNFGGLRAALPEGPITFGNIFEITPFENTLVILELKGSDMLRVFQQMCQLKNGCLSGATLESKGRKLISAKIGGKEIDPERTYYLATLDYVAEGNDGFTVLQEFKDWNMPEGATLRQCFLDYVMKQTAEGKKVDAKVEGRFIWEE